MMKKRTSGALNAFESLANVRCNCCSAREVHLRCDKKYYPAFRADKVCYRAIFEAPLDSKNMKNPTCACEKAT